MEVSGLVDKRAILQVIGCLLQDSSLIDDIDRPLSRDDFAVENFYELLFVAIYNLHMTGVQSVDEFAIDSYLSNYKEQYRIFQDNNGLEYLSTARELSSLENYEYNYHRIRKYSLLRYYEKQGLDTRFIYDSTIAEGNKAEAEQIKFDNYTETDIVEMVEATFVINPNMKYCTNNLTEDCQAGEGLDELVEELMQEPDVGVPLNSPALNTITRGARKGCLYMRSCVQGGGKSRLAAGDACKIAVPYYYDTEKEKWIYTGVSEPVLYITTEMSNREIMSIFLAIVSGVNEEHILYGVYDKGELERVKQATQYIKSSPLRLCNIPDFSIQDIKNIVKKYNREFGVEYFFFDYIFSSLRLMSEINSKSGMGLKEHQLLLVFATELKALCQQLNVFMFTASQLNGEAVNAPIKDQNLLAGSKALSNKLDVGYIAMAPNKAELKRVEPILHKMVGCPVPNMCTWIYKVRSGRITRVIIWSWYDLGTMRVKDLFVTNHNFELIDVDFTQIEVVEEKLKENSVLMSKIPNSKDEQNYSDEEEISERRFDW